MTNARHSSVESGSSAIAVALSLPPPQAGRTSSSSGRAMQASRIGASRDQSAMYSIRSRRVGSAHWMSSITKTTGRDDAIDSSSLRIAQSVSSGTAAPPAPITCAIRSRDPAPVGVVAQQPEQLRPHLRRAIGVDQASRNADRVDDRRERDAVAIREAATLEDGRPVRELVRERAEQPRLADAADPEHREELTRTVRDRSFERATQEVELACPSHHRSVEAPEEPSGTRDHA